MSGGDIAGGVRASNVGYTFILAPEAQVDEPRLLSGRLRIRVPSGAPEIKPPIA